MESNLWKEIWRKKGSITSGYSGDEFVRFCELKKANGFDVAVDDEYAYFSAFYKGWIQFYNKIIELFGDINSIFEVGCGSGVNLFMFKNRIPDVALGGCDYSESMIKSAKLSTTCKDFSCCGADEISIEPIYDVVMAESVFQYFESKEYAENVLRKMIQKSKKLTYLGEIHNKEYEELLMNYRRETIENYEERYKGLNKLFLEKDWIERIAKKYNKTVIFTDVDNPEYLNGKYEYNCFIF